MTQKIIKDFFKYADIKSFKLIKSFPVGESYVLDVKLAATLSSGFRFDYFDFKLVFLITDIKSARVPECNSNNLEIVTNNSTYIICKK